MTANTPKKPIQESTLFTPFQMKGIELKNRFVMAPMTRSRATQSGNVPNDLMATYYGQRASAGLIISEATQISPQGQGYANTPGIYSQAQVNGWKKITSEVHASNHGGSKIFLQLWHVGRVSSAQVNGLQPIAPSAIPAKDTKVYIFDGAPNGDATMIPVDAPREMTQEDIQQTIDDFRTAARNAINAGFDGVEIHAANGYLLDQFLRSNSNQRTDKYGGSQKNRIRFITEITAAVVDEIGAQQTGIRLSPFISFKDMNDPEILDTIMLAAEELEKLQVTYIHLCEADWDDAPEIPNDFRRELRRVFSNAIIATGNMTPEKANTLLDDELIDLAGFGRKFLTNPNYPERVAQGTPLNEISDTHTLFGGLGSRGYTDY